MFLIAREVDPRLLQFLKIGFVRADHTSTGMMDKATFQKIFIQAMKRDDQEIFEVIFNFAKENDEIISFGRLTELIDNYQLYPHIVKKDKN